MQISDLLDFIVMGVLVWIRSGVDKRPTVAERVVFGHELSFPQSPQDICWRSSPRDSMNQQVLHIPDPL